MEPAIIFKKQKDGSLGYGCTEQFTNSLRTVFFVEINHYSILIFHAGLHCFKNDMMKNRVSKKKSMNFFKPSGKTLEVREQ